jgi:hypothetical protein
VDLTPDLNIHILGFWRLFEKIFGEKFVPMGTENTEARGHGPLEEDDARPWRT